MASDDHRASEHHSRERHTEPAAIGIRYFELAETLAPEGHAIAYPCRFDEGSGTWKKIQRDTPDLRTIYDRFKGIGGKNGTQLQCVWMPGSQRWEVLGPPGQGIYRGITLATLTKGSNANVTRYLPGTTTDSGITDDVYNELATVGAGKVVYYFLEGTKMWVLQAECPLT